ncbi:hypothetical protein [Nonomuraea sp. NPDC048826]|uniref:hypothetical protein n=1 Tax=Nonomuraea sp. NPDC048826 TaxID=3364347 RepID=UPI003724372A
MPTDHEKADDPTVVKDPLVERAERLIDGDLPPDEYFQDVERRAEDLADSEARRSRPRSFLSLLVGRL